MKRWMTAVLAGWAVWGAGAAAPAQEKVTATMSYIFHGGHTAFFAALGRGAYQKAGMDVSIQRGYGSKATLTSVFTGKSQFGEAGAGTTVISRSQDVKVKQVGMIYHNDQSEVITLGKTGIRSPADFKGRRLGDVPASSTRTIFPALLARNGLKESDIQFVNMTAAALGPSLLAGKVDMILTFAVTAVPLKMKARSSGLEMVEIPYSEHGLPLYGNGAIASDALIASNPDLVRRFVRATIESLAWSVDHPEEAVRHLVRQSPSLSYEPALEQWKTTIRFVATPESLKTGLGHMERDKMQATLDIVRRYMGDKLGPNPVKAEDLFTNAFVPAKVRPAKAR